MKVFKINISAGYEYLCSKGFTLAKLCGEGFQGLVTALGMNYIEGMILSQNSNANGYVFIEKYLEKLRDDDIYEEILRVFDNISQGVADHEDFARAVKMSPDLQGAVFQFTLGAFKISNCDGDMGEIIQKLSTASSMLNIQINIYSTEGHSHMIKKNRYIYPIVLNIYAPESSSEFYTLYHQNYKIISPENLNTSLDFIPSHEAPTVNPQRDLIKKLAKDLSTQDKLILQDKDQLTLLIEDLKHFDFLGFECERLLSHLLK